MSLTFAGRWFTVEITGENEPLLIPAVSKQSALWTAQAALDAVNSPHKPIRADHAKQRHVERWIDGYREQTEDPNLPNPTEWRRTIYETLRTQLNEPTPEPTPIPTTPTPADRTALQATWWRITLIGRPTLLAVALLTLITTIGLALLPQRPALFILTTITLSLTAAIFVAEWLNRIDSPTMKWCPQCNTAVPATHKHPRTKHNRNHNDENQRRRILNDYRNTVGEWCRGTPDCDPGGHTTSPNNPLTVDHVRPQSKGGTLEDGYRIICRKANSARGNKPIGA